MVGLAIGVPLALASSRVLGAQLYGVEARDPKTLAVATVVLLASGLLAAALAAIRAASVDPGRALRAE
jgi:ABC-type antimicrobial peptide transport system permease subunit